MAIAGEDYCVIAADTRQSEGYSINARYVPKAWKLNDTTVIAANGFHADGVRLKKDLDSQIRMYKYQHGHDMGTASVAQLCSVTLYGHRMFPYYAFTILGGLDAEGRGAVYSFDPVGSFEREQYRAGGSGASLIQPLLDNQVGKKNIVPGVAANIASLSLDDALKMTRDAFVSAAERDIHTGDYVEIWIITKRDGVRSELYPLRRD